MSSGSFLFCQNGDALDAPEDYQLLQAEYRSLSSKYESAQDEIADLTSAHARETADLRAKIELLEAEKRSLTDEQELWRSVAAAEFSATKNSLLPVHSKLRVIDQDLAKLRRLSLRSSSAQLSLLRDLHNTCQRAFVAALEAQAEVLNERASNRELHLHAQMTAAERENRLLRRNCQSLLDMIGASADRGAPSPFDLHARLEDIRLLFEDAVVRRAAASLRAAFPEAPLREADLAASLREYHDGVVSRRDAELRALSLACASTTRELRTVLAESASQLPASGSPPALRELRALSRGWQRQRAQLDAAMRELSESPRLTP
jgi:hypothetical protein